MEEAHGDEDLGTDMPGLGAAGSGGDPAQLADLLNKLVQALGND
jgi:hypothetical protein